MKHKQFQTGYHPGEIVDSSTMKIIAKCDQDNNRDLIIKILNEHSALVKVAEAAEFVNRFLAGSTDYDHALISGSNLTPRRKIESALFKLKQKLKE